MATHSHTQLVRGLKRRPFPVDIVAVCVLTGLLWCLWPRTPAIHARGPRPRKPFSSFVSANLTTVARSHFAGPALQGRGPLPGAVEMPNWEDVPRGEVPALPEHPFAPSEEPPLRLPPLPEVAPPRAPVPAMQFVAVRWALDISDALASGGIQFDEAALRDAAAALPGRGAGFADVTVGPGGFPETVLLSIEAPEPRGDMLRALLRARGPVGGPQVSGRVRWIWNNAPADESVAAKGEADGP